MHTLEKWQEYVDRVHADAQLLIKLGMDKDAAWRDACEVNKGIKPGSFYCDKCKGYCTLALPD